MWCGAPFVWAYLPYEKQGTVVVLLSETMISLSNTCVWGTQLLHSPGILSFGLSCAGECSIQLEENNKPRLAAFIPHHLGKDGVIMISVCLEDPRSSSHLAQPALFPLLLKSQHLFPYVYFLPRRFCGREASVRKPRGSWTEAPNRLNIESAEKRIWPQISFEVLLYAAQIQNVY